MRIGAALDSAYCKHRGSADVEVASLACAARFDRGRLPSGGANWDSGFRIADLMPSASVGVSGESSASSSVPQAMIGTYSRERTAADTDDSTLYGDWTLTIEPAAI